MSPVITRGSQVRQNTLVLAEILEVRTNGCLVQIGSGQNFMTLREVEALFGY